MIRPLKRKDIKHVVRIHADSLSESFFAQFGKLFMRKVYKGFLVSKYSQCFVFEENKKIEGFIVGVKDAKKATKEILMRYWLDMLMAIIFKILISPSLIIKILSACFYHHKTRCESKKGKEIKSELVLLAVDKQYQGKRIGTCLTQKINEYFKINKIFHYKLSAYSGRDANHFYMRRGYKFEGKCKIYGKIINLYKISLKDTFENK